MARRLASLLVDIQASTAGLQRDVNRAVGIVDRGATQMSAALAKTKALFSGLAIGAATGLATFGIARGMRAVVDATVEAENAMRQLDARIKSTGGAAGLSAKQISTFADELQSVTTFDDDAIISTQTLLLTFTRITGETFDAATRAILNMSIAMDQDLKSSTVQIGKALNDPIKGLTSLARAGVSFTAQQKEQIKQMVAVGDLAGAQKMILSELATEFGGAAQAARNTLGGALEALGNSIGNLLENDSASLPKLTAEINKLNKTLTDPAVKSGIDSFTSAMLTGFGLIVKAAAAVGDNIEKITFAARALANVGGGFVAGGLIAGPPGAAVGAIAGAGKLAIQESARQQQARNTASGIIERTPTKTVAPAVNLGPTEAQLKTQQAAADATARAAEQAARAAAQAEKQRLASIQSIVDALADENFALGKSTEEVLRNNLEKLNAPPVEVERAVQLLRENEAYKVNTDSIEKYNAALKKVQEEGAAVAESVRTPSEVLNQELTRLARLRELSAFSADAARNEEIYARAVGAAWKAASESTDKAKDAMNEFALEAARGIQSALGDQLYNILQGNFDNIGSQFKSMLDRMVAEALAAQLAKKLFGDFGSTGSIGGIIGKVFGAIGASSGGQSPASILPGFAKGAAFGGGKVIPFARGGIVSTPTLFPMANGAGLMGEAGPEAIMPLKRMPGGGLGVQSSGGGGGVVVHLYISGIQDARGVREAGANVAARTGAAVNAALARNR